jgi:ABC-type sugar transport system permease subunit
VELAGVPSSRRARRWSAAVSEAPFLLPALVLVGGAILLPALYSLYRSFYDWQPGYPSPFVGLANYRELFELSTFREVLQNQFFLLLGLPLWTFLPLVLAVVMHERTRFVGLVRSIFLFPAVLSPAIVAIMLRSVLKPDGLLNTTLGTLGLNGLEARWIDSPALVKPTLIFVLLWANLGIGVIIFSAALATVSRDVLRAAEVDGAGWWARLVHVILPSLSTVTYFWMIYNVIGVFFETFGWVYVLTGGGPGYSSSTLDFDIYKRAFTSGSFGRAAAECVVLVLIVLLLCGGAWLLTRLYRWARNVRVGESRWWART